MTPIAAAVAAVAVPTGLLMAGQWAPAGAAERGQCGDHKSASKLILGKEKHRIVARMNRRIGKKKGETPGYNAVFLTATADMKHWYLLQANEPLGKPLSDKGRLCIVLKGTDLKLLDNVKYMKGFENPVELTIKGKKRKLTQGVLHHLSKGEARRVYEKLQKSGGNVSQRKNPNFITVLNNRLDVRKAKSACRTLRKRVGSKIKCLGHEDYLYVASSRYRLYPAVQGYIGGRDGKPAWIMTIAASPRKNHAFWEIQTTLAGASVLRRTGRKFSVTKQGRPNIGK